MGVRTLAHHQGSLQALRVLPAARRPHAGDGVRESVDAHARVVRSRHVPDGRIGDPHHDRAIRSWAAREPIEDAARVISRMVDIVMIRTFEQAKLERFAAHSRVPVINGLTNEYHPCQILADIFTFIEHRGDRSPGEPSRGSATRTTWHTRGCRRRRVFGFRRERVDAAGLRRSTRARRPTAGDHCRCSPIRWTRCAAPTWSRPTSGPAWASRPKTTTRKSASTTGRSTPR